MDIFNLHLVEIIAFLSDFFTDSQGSSRKYTPAYAYLTGYHNPYHAAERVVEELINRAVGDFEMDQEDRHLISRYYKCVFVGVILDWLRHDPDNRQIHPSGSSGTDVSWLFCSSELH